MPQPDRSESEFVPRAPRYAVQMPIRYRLRGTSGWRDGTTENISRSGVLFRCERVLEHSTWLEMNLALPAEIAGERAANVICRGRIVRAIAPDDTGDLPVVAATIEEFGFVRTPESGGS